MRIFLLAAMMLAGCAAIAQKQQASDAKSKVGFSIKNFGMKTDGRLSGLQGTMELDPGNAEPVSISLSVDANTIDTDNRMRDNHLRKADYFDVAKYPRLSFSSSSITKTSNGYLVKGTLTIKGISRNIEINSTVSRNANSYTFNGSFPINRRDYKVGGGSISLSDDLTVNFQITFIQ